jgi:quercetin 2,3-dioxygenase
MPSPTIMQIQALASQWPTLDPFLFCVHHDDAYPTANADLSPNAALTGRQLGQDFSGKDGWSLYHGHPVPGFPAHPHRGFETVTIVRNGLIDHSDSLGASARFGRGDVQWLTAGQGIVHAEMFPLLQMDQSNPLELFQIWLNLPAANKRVAPHFTMFWADTIPRARTHDAKGLATEVVIIAGALATAAAPLAPPPDSWAAAAPSDLAIWTLRMQAGARYTLPIAKHGVRRQLYFFQGQTVLIAGQEIACKNAIELSVDQPVELVNGAQSAEFLLLQGKPIAEPIVQYGPFVMNTRAEIEQTLAEYRRTQFGGWPWKTTAPTHGRMPQRFAKYPDGRLEQPAD